MRAAREALSREHLAQPRRRGDREAIRVLVCTREGAVLTRTRAISHLHRLVVNAPEGIRNQLRKLTTDELLARCARLRTAPSQSVEHRSTITALRSTARRALACEYCRPSSTSLRAYDENRFLERHGWDDYAAWHLGSPKARTTARRPATP